MAENDIAFNTLGKNNKKFDWSGIDYTKLNTSSKSQIDWEEVDFKKAAKAATFDLDVVDFSEVNTATTAKTKKVYRDINWEQVDYSELEADTKSSIDWAQVDFKEAKINVLLILLNYDFKEIMHN